MVLVVTGSQADEQLRKRFLAEAPAAWEQYRAFADDLVGSTETLREVNQQPRSRIRIEYKANLNCRMHRVIELMPRKRADSRADDELVSKNPHYTMKLGRKPPDGRWVLHQIALTMPGKANPINKDFFFDTTELRCLIQINTEALPALPKQATFILVDVRWKDFEGERMAEIEFTNRHPLPGTPKGFFAIQGGKIILDPNRYWCVRTSDLICKYGGGYHDTVVKQYIELRKSTGKFPIPKRRQHSLFSKDKQFTVTDTTEYDLRERSNGPEDADFYASAFGLPEPTGITAPARSRWYLWFLGIGAVALGAGWYWRRRVLQHRALTAILPN
jgi:hypothetical protein